MIFYSTLSLYHNSFQVIAKQIGIAINSRLGSEPQNSLTFQVVKYSAIALSLYNDEKQISPVFQSKRRQLSAIIFLNAPELDYLEIDCNQQNQRSCIEPGLHIYPEAFNTIFMEEGLSCNPTVHHDFLSKARELYTPGLDILQHTSNVVSFRKNRLILLKPKTTYSLVSTGKKTTLKGQDNSYSFEQSYLYALVIVVQY